MTVIKGQLNFEIFFILKSALGGRPLITLRMVGEGGFSTERNDGVTWGRGVVSAHRNVTKAPPK